MAEVNHLLSVENTQPCHSRSSRSSYACHPPLSSVNQSDQSRCRSPAQFLVKEKNGHTVDKTTDKGQESEKENCLAPDWEPVEWSRVGSLSSRSISKMEPLKSPGLDYEVLAELQVKNAALDQSPCVDVACVRSNAPAQSDKSVSRKKPRLGWGDGLAKYEKKKVVGPEECTSKNQLALSSITTESASANLLEPSPGVESLSDCISPATPSSVACSSSPGAFVEVKEVNGNHVTTNLRCFPSVASPGQHGGPIPNLETLELESITNLSSLMNKLPQPSDPSSAETGYFHTTSINKLLMWKVDILKALEMTESEIESLEAELKSLINESTIHCSHPAGTRSSKISSSGETTVNDTPVVLENRHALSTDEYIDDPHSATSKFVGMLPAMFLTKKAEFSEGARNVDVNSSGGLEEKCFKVSSNHESTGNVNNTVPIRNTSLEVLLSSSKVYCNVDNLCISILSFNRIAASRALEQLNKLLPKQCCFDGSIKSTVSSLQNTSSVVREIFLKRKQFIQFKEKVLTLKFKVLLHFFKQGRSVSIRRLREKTRKFDRSQNGRNRICSPVSFYAGGRQAVRADEVIEYVNDLLLELAFKPYRSVLKMPALILDKQVKMSRFISNNGLVEDPRVVEKERSVMNPWTDEEKDNFLEKLAALGKDFRKIASFLDHKTVANCIEFYYKNHKSECFKKTRKDSGFMKQRKSQTAYLVASGKRRNPEVNAASLDVLGAASELAAKNDNAVDIWQKFASRSSFGASGKGSDSVDTDNALAGICHSLSSEAMSSSNTSSVDLCDGGGYRSPRCLRINPSKHPLSSEFTQEVHVDCSDGICRELNPTDWSDEEKSVFIQAISSYGKDFGMVSQSVGTKSTDRCKVFFSKARKCLGLDLIRPVAATALGREVNDCCTTEEHVPPPNNSFPSFQEPETVLIASEMLSEQGMQKQDDVVMPNRNMPLVEVSGGEENQCQGPMLPEDNMPSGTRADKKSDNPREGNVGTCSSETPCASLLQSGHLVSVASSTRNHNPSLPNDADDTHSPKFVTAGDLRSLNSTECSQILQGYAVSLQTTGGAKANGNAGCEKERRTGFLHEKFEETKQSKAAFPSVERGTGCLSAGEHPPRNGGVKLFGKILSSSQQKPCNFVERADDHSLRHESPNPKLSSGQVSFDFRQQPNLDCNDIPPENTPVRRFGFWNGNRIQTGIPDSALLLAKYPAAFSNFALPPLHGAFQSERLPDHQGLRARVMQTQQDNVFVEMQRRNANNVGTGMQHGREGPGLGIAGRVVFGGQCSGVSDPVVAIKMQYAKAEQLRMQGGNVVDIDRWITNSNRDLGR